MKLFSIFKRPKTVDDVFDKDAGLLVKFGGFVNNLNLTDEEVLKQNAKTVADVQSFVKDTLSESTDRSRTRRQIAQLWIKSQLALVLMCAIAAPFDMKLAEFYFTLASSVLMFSTTTAIVVFFFGSHGLSKFQDKQNNKKGA